jgi:hypothetical protein
MPRWYVEQNGVVDAQLRDRARSGAHEVQQTCGRSDTIYAMDSRDKSICVDRKPVDFPGRSLDAQRGRANSADSAGGVTQEGLRPAVPSLSQTAGSGR